MDVSVLRDSGAIGSQKHNWKMHKDQLRYFELDH